MLAPLHDYCSKCCLMFCFCVRITSHRMCTNKVLYFFSSFLCYIFLFVSLEQKLSVRSGSVFITKPDVDYVYTRYIYVLVHHVWKRARHTVCMKYMQFRRTLFLVLFLTISTLLFIQYKFIRPFIF